jgi:hypothetical protein
VVKKKQKQEQTSLTRPTNPQKSPMIQTPAKTGAASSSHPADAVGASALVSIQKERQNKRTIERCRLPTKDSNGEFKDSLMVQEFRKLVKSKILHTVKKFIPVGSNLQERMVAGCIKKLDLDRSSWDDFKNILWEGYRVFTGSAA